MTRRTLPSSISVALAIALGGTPVRTFAAEAPVVAPSDTRTQAKVRFDEGLAAYERSDFAGAIEAWTSARALMADDPAAQDAWHVLGLDLAQAHVRAYRLDRDVGHFAPARALLEAYVAWVDRPAHTMTPDEQEDRPRAVEMLAFIATEREHRSDSIAPLPAPAPRAAVAPAPDRAAPPIDDAAHQRKLKTAHGLIAGGAVSLGLGVASSVVLGVSVSRAMATEREYVDTQAGAQQDGVVSDAERAELDDIAAKGKSANQWYIASAVAVAVFTAAGVGLLAGGLVARKRALRAAPVVGKGYGGVAVSMRF